MEDKELMPMEEIKKKLEEENLPVKQEEVIKDTEVMNVVKKEEQTLLQSEEYKEIAKKTGEERIKSDIAQEAARIREKNMKTAETLFETETREKRLQHLKAELDLDHKYRMATLKEDNEHKQMLDKRRKLVEKYGYLYNNDEENLIEKVDSKGDKYLCPKDFSYSKGVNRMRQFGRNISKLDKPILQTIKWFLIIGGIVIAVVLLKHFHVF